MITRFFKVLDSSGLAFDRNYDGMVLKMVDAEVHGIKGYHRLLQPPMDNNGNEVSYPNCYVTMQEPDSITEVFLTSEQKKTIRHRYLSFETNMSDPWRNDFSEDGQSADEHRRECMEEDLKHELYDVPWIMIETFLEEIS